MTKNRTSRGLEQRIKESVSEAQKIVRKHNLTSLPYQHKLIELGYGGLAYAIRDQGGFRKFRQLLGEDKVVREAGTWQSLEYTLAQAHSIIKEHHLEKLPSQNELKELGYGGLAHAISDYHGGFKKFRKLLGEKKIIREVGLWKKEDYILAEAISVMERQDLETLPSYNKLCKLGYSSLARAISDYHGGFRTFRKLLNQEKIRKEKGIWQDLEYAIAEVQKLIKENDLEILPGHRRLKELGYSSLASAIPRYHGGFTAFRFKLGEYDKELRVVKKLIEEAA